MLAAFDAQMVIWAFDERVDARVEGPHGEVDQMRERVQRLLADLAQAQHQVIIPAPALAEFLVKVQPAEQGRLLAILNRSAAIRVEPFDAPAASECARVIAGRLSRGPLGVDHPGGRTAIKFDIQIVAIATVLGVEVIYSSDKGVKTLAAEQGIRTVAVWELPTPEAQSSLFD